MRARLIAFVSLGLVVALVWVGLSVADARLEEQFRNAVPLDSAIPPPMQGSDGLPSSAASGFDPVRPDTSISSWARENEFVLKQNGARHGWGPAIYPQVREWEGADDSGGAASGEDGVIDVLVVGDSFVWGLAVSDLDMLWPKILEHELNSRGGGRFRVTSLGRAPASFAQFADWLTPERLQELNPDVVVVGLLANDFYPTFEESVMCNAYGTCTGEGESPTSNNPRNMPLVACLTGDGSMLNSVLRTVVNPRFPYVGRWLTDRYCDPDKVAGADGFFAEGRWMDQPQDNPHWWVFTQAVPRLAKALEGVPHVIFDYDSITEDPARQPAVRDALLASGLSVLSGVSARALRTVTSGSESLQINPADNHPGPRLTRAYALDVADWVYKELGMSPGSAEPYVPDLPLLSNYLPAALDVRSGRDWFSVISGPRVSSEEPGGKVRLWMDGYGRVEVEGPCAAMGRPHARVMLNPYLPADSVALLRLTASQSQMVAWPVGYSEDGTPISSEPVALDPDRTVEVPLRPGISGFLVGPTKGGCPDTSVTMPRFQLDVRLKP